ncbi:MAG: hypothetical protein ED557_04930 [Balneola sp.]|nr:MAG: hypothetical protein ED557_04930 [Balneola sp.]
MKKVKYFLVLYVFIGSFLIGGIEGKEKLVATISSDPDCTVCVSCTNSNGNVCQGCWCVASGEGCAARGVCEPPTVAEN